MGTEKGKRGRKVGGMNEGSRKSQMLALESGEKIVFYCPDGWSASKTMNSIGSTFRGDDSMGKHGLTQKKALLVIEGEVSVPVVVVEKI